MEKEQGYSSESLMAVKQLVKLKALALVLVILLEKLMVQLELGKPLELQMSALALVIERLLGQ